MRKILLATAALLIASPAFAADNYTATAGSGLTFAAKDNGGGVLFSRFIGCDNTTTTQCWVVDASGRLTVNVNGTVPISIASGQVASGAISAGAYAAGALVAGAAVDGWDATQGAKGDAACGSSNGTCSIAALLKYNNAQAATTATNSALPLPTQSNRTSNIGTVDGGVNLTLTDCSGTIATGGTAQNAITAQTTLHGYIIKNIDASAGSGEPLWFSFTGTATANTAASYPLAAPATTTFANGESFTTPMGLGTNHAVSVVAATTGHKFSCTWW